MESLFTEIEVARQIGVSVRTLRRWHSYRIGPARIKAGRKVLYREGSVSRWLEHHEQGPIEQGGTS